MSLNIENMLSRLVEDAGIREGMKVKDLAMELDGMGGFTAKYLARAIEILRGAIIEDHVIFLSFTGNLIATGLRGAIRGLLSRGFADVIFTTGGAIDHDMARSFGAKYYHGEFDVDDRELRKLGIHRLGNIFIPAESYGPLIEKATWSIIDKASKIKSEWGLRELISFVGKNIGDGNSILRTAYEEGIPVYAPGALDSSFGTSISTYAETHEFRLNFLIDMRELFELAFSADGIAGLIIGGGISKHHAVWWAQFKEGLKKAVYVTTAPEWDGSLSGARTREAITWGKIRPEADQVTVYGDATVLLPLMLAALYDELAERNIRRREVRCRDLLKWP